METGRHGPIEIWNNILRPLSVFGMSIISMDESLG